MFTKKNINKAWNCDVELLIGVSGTLGKTKMQQWADTHRPSFLATPQGVVFDCVRGGTAQPELGTTNSAVIKGWVALVTNSLQSSETDSWTYTVEFNNAAANQFSAQIRSVSNCFKDCWFIASDLVFFFSSPEY